MFCESCGSFIPDGQSFCSNCGAAAPQPVQQAPAEEPAPAPAPAPQPQEAAPQQEYQSFIPRNNRNVQITIPDFLKNRK